MKIIRATPLHSRTAALNPLNRWMSRNGFTLATDFGDSQAEALAARTNVIITDISWRWRVILNGPRTSDMLSRLAARDPHALAPGGSLKSLWLNDGGAVRGAGVFARYAVDQYRIVSGTTDEAWFSNVARQFEVTMQDVTDKEGGVALIGPYAKAVLDAAGLNTEIAPLGFHKLFWRSLDVTVSRWGEHDGYEIWCGADDCAILWSRLLRAGESFGIAPAGLDACDILDIEAGVLRPARDYLPAADGFGTTPTPSSLGLESLIDEENVLFNGRRSWLANRLVETAVCVGVEIDSETPAPFTPLIRDGKIAGHMLSSVRSPMLRRGIGLAQVDAKSAAVGTMFSLTLPLSLEASRLPPVSARIVPLPFLNPPGSSA
jgi:aminomethyltransferase